jgi:hypothetical protein
MSPTSAPPSTARSSRSSRIKTSKSKRKTRIRTKTRNKSDELARGSGRADPGQNDYASDDDGLWSKVLWATYGKLDVSRDEFKSF